MCTDIVIDRCRHEVFNFIGGQSNSMWPCVEFRFSDMQVCLFRTFSLVFGSVFAWYNVQRWNSVLFRMIYGILLPKAVDIHTKYDKLYHFIINISLHKWVYFTNCSSPEHMIDDLGKFNILHKITLRRLIFRIVFFSRNIFTTYVMNFDK